MSSDIQRLVMVNESVSEGGELDLDLGLARLLRQRTSDGQGAPSTASQWSPAPRPALPDP